MRGLKRSNPRAFLILWLAAAAVAVSSGQNRKTTAPQMVGSATLFAGWRGESAVIQNESRFEDGRAKEKYYLLGVDSRWVALASVKRPANLVTGTVLVKDYEPVPHAPAVVFHLDADEKQSRALEEALNAWREKGEGRPQDFPEVHATFRIALSGREVWVKKKTLSVAMGEAAYEYRPPKLRFASLSPSRTVLLVELTGSDGSSFFRIPVPFRANPPRKPN